MCFYGSQLLQHWEQQLLQQQQQQGGATTSGTAAGEPSGGSGDGCSRPARQEAEGLLLLGAAALEGCSHRQQQQQQQWQWQQQLALCRQYQQQFQQTASKLGFSRQLMAAVAAWFTEAEQYSSSSSSEGVAADGAAAADCLPTVCAAALMLGSVQTLVDPSKRARSPGWQVTAGEELLVADFILKVCHSATSV
jgi:hypothetical protein